MSAPLGNGVEGVERGGVRSMKRRMSFFFFQAEDGIRDYKVTGVQACPLPISSPAPALHVRVESDRSVQAPSRRDPLVPGVHQAIQRFAGNRSRNANRPWLIERGNDGGLSLSHHRLIITFPTGLLCASPHAEHHIRRMRSALPCAIFSRSTSLIESVLRNSIPAVFGSYGQSTANRILSAPSASSVHRNAGSYQLPLVVTSRLSFRYSSGVFLRPRRAAARQV